MRCNRARRLLSRKAAQSVSIRQERKLEEHLGACEACSRLTDDLDRAWGALEYHPTVEPSADFIPMLKARLREEDTSSPGRARPVLSWRLVAMAACLLFAAVFLARLETGRQNPSPSDLAAVLVAEPNVPDEQFLRDLEEILQQPRVDFLSAYDVWPGISQDSADREAQEPGQADRSNKKERPS